MLRELHIQNLALIDQLDLELEGGLSVFTGETGAGKSILMNAMGLLMGDRADSGLVRHSSERAEVAADFDLADLPQVQEWLERSELDSDGECQIRRTISPEGRSKAYVNGRPVPVQTLKQLGEMLLEIHGQHEHQNLMRSEQQLQLLDGFAGIQEQVKELFNRYRHWRNLEREREQIDSQSGEHVFQLQLLRYQVKELEEFNLSREELDRLHADLKKLAHADETIRHAAQAAELLDSESQPAALSMLNQAHQHIIELLDVDSRFAEAGELLNNALIQAQEAQQILRRSLDQLESDPERLAEVEQRLNQAADLARKHQVTVDELPEHLQILQKELANLEDAGNRLEQLTGEIKAARKAYLDLATDISAWRADAAPRLAKVVNRHIRELGMPEATLEVLLHPRPDDQPAATGLEKVEFQFSANPGHPLQPLAKVASGGELSRLGLAIKMATLEQDQIPTLIFDEVDTGIGGSVASKVGQMLHKLGDSHQVFCVTHQPQVAGQGHHHYVVSKSTDKDKKTTTRIQRLDEHQRIDELSRMMAGDKVSEHTRGLARELMGGKR